MKSNLNASMLQKYIVQWFIALGGCFIAHDARCQEHALPLYVSFPDSMRAPAERAHGLHRHTMCDALVALFETAVPESEKTAPPARTVLSKVLCNLAIAFDKPILDFITNRHLEVLARPGTPSNCA